MENPYGSFCGAGHRHERGTVHAAADCGGGLDFPSDRQHSADEPGGRHCPHSDFYTVYRSHLQDAGYKNSISVSRCGT